MPRDRILIAAGDRTADTGIFSPIHGKFSFAWIYEILQAPVVPHISNRAEQIVRYYGYYCNRARGDRKKKGKDDEVQALMTSVLSSKELCRSWACRIKKIYDANPLFCPKCQGRYADLG